MTQHKYRLFAWIAVLLSFVLYTVQAYWIKREDFASFFGSYALLFLLFYWISLNKQTFSFNLFATISILFRLVFLFAIPALSNDFYRFIWDGELITNLINPYAHKPDELISFGGFLDEPRMRILYHGMGELSQQNYTCYPPLNQILFLIPAIFSDDIHVQLIILKLIIISADIGIIWIGKKILDHLKLSRDKIWLFILNPLVIIEFTGNVHFEGVMLFFLLIAVYLLLKRQWLFATFFIALSIHVKLLPFMLIPLFIKYIGFRRWILFGALTGIFTLLLGVVFLNNEFLIHLLNSLSNYFSAFEFNAGLFYVIREIGFAVKGYDVIQTAGPILGFVVLLSILFLSTFRSFQNQLDLIKLILFAFVIYYFFSAIVHPWYVTSILLFSIFTNYKFGLIWSLLVMLSYSAYTVDGVVENPIFIATEYCLVFAVLLTEIFLNKRNGLLSLEKSKLINGHV